MLPSVASTLFYSSLNSDAVGWQEGHPKCKKTVRACVRVCVRFVISWIVVIYFYVKKLSNGVALAQLCATKLQWDAPKSPRNCPFLFDDHLLQSNVPNFTHPSTDLTHHPKQHPDSLSRLATIHFLNRQTYGIGKSPVPITLTLCCIDEEQCAKKL